MDYARFLEATGLLNESGLDIAAAGRLAARLSRGLGISDLIERPPHGLGELPLRTLERLTYAYQLYLDRRKAITELEKERKAAKAKPLPPEILGRPTYSHSVRALARVAKAVDAITFNSQEFRSKTLEAGVELWERCFAIAWRNGQVKVSASDPDNPALEDFGDHVNTRVEPAGLQPHRWLAVRRGNAMGLLSMELAVPVDSLVGQVNALHDKLEPLLESRSPVSLLDELVVPFLENEVFRALDDEMAEAAIWSAASSYFDLLRSPPVDAAHVASIYASSPDQAVAVTIVSNEGVVQSHRLVAPGDAWSDEVVAFLEESGVKDVVLPVSCLDQDRLGTLKRLLAERFKVRQVRTAGLRQSRESLPDREGFPKDVQSAWVLALRAFRPFEEWSKLDPLSLGLAEYQAELDQDRLRRALMEMRIVARLRPDEDNSPTLVALTTSFNPLVRSLSDLKPGMPVLGTVTNITSFGVFVNIGLKQEGMIHISELSDDFVRDPHEVVKIGQQVQPRILAVDETRNRISLTLRKTERRPPARRGSSAPGKGARGGERVEALKNLENLFKKK